MRRIPFISGDEQDALTKAKKYLTWRPGERKKLKRAYNKRFRKLSQEKYCGQHRPERPTLREVWGF
jgi:plasmid stabilization system protein ParE